MKKKLLQKLADAIIAIGEHVNPPTVRGPEHGFREWTLCWDGPMGWCTSVSMGEHPYFDEFPDACGPMPPAIAKVIEQIEEAGYYLEPVDSSSQITLAN
jgi:hypothetical protein